MNEEQAREATRAIVGDLALSRIERFVARVRDESERQNLVSRPTLDALWHRHVLDSAQLLQLAPAEGLWLDVGTGAGFPGLVIALATDRPVVLVEPRRKRADFLRSVVEEEGGAGRVEVKQAKVESLAGLTAAVISARAVAWLPDLLERVVNVAARGTVYLLPKGQSATTEADDARRRFDGLFHVEQSLTDPASGIVVATGVKRR